MTTFEDRTQTVRTDSDTTTRLLLAERGDALVSYLTRALRDRYTIAGSLDVELTQPQRLLTAAVTFRPSRRDWAERFYKSNLAVDLRSRNAAAAQGQVEHPYDVVFQTHALFEIRGARSVLYVDCTHHQSAREWPQWNPLRGRALQRWYDREQGQYQRAAHLFAFSQPTARSLVEEYAVPPERVSVVGAGVNFETLPQPRGEGSNGGSGSPPTVLFVGNDFVRKGGPDLLRAFAQLRRRVPDARLQIVGTRHPVPEQPGVEVLGRIFDRAEVARLYAAATVFVLPSHFDAYPLVLLEAMAQGLPCVVTPTCGVPEMVDEGTATTVPVGDPERLAAALVDLLRDPVRAAQMGQRGRERVEQGFLWSQVVDRMAPALNALA